ncbi:putative lipid phosphate phosphatase 3, chloroplastic isoform X2 [Coffea eugenioides]|uniref:putative lipid phosphate phosphatase 3, chloroplastic isoform X2 n=1 Tax=Coffea eugenioides TaxID=49369 RepID=UPI000F60B5F2|nr:putative lipid phosphate phosphatase 3, chloroplastic isoform X2 [Coffea eugenioides]XP_027179308.1 putative lipid phosphate phosphatase 3, chloroplastic isoform X2 [Coffea eugenioides]
MREAQLGTHTVRTHGVTLARKHMHDWLILMLLAAIVVILNVINPFYRYVGKDMMADLKYPMKENTVPVWAVPVYAILLPMVVFLLFYLRRPDVYDLHHAILGLLFSVLVTGVITDAIKDAVGRPRPDFFWRCFPDGKDVYDQWGNVECHGQKDILKDGRKSFPSGHTSCLIVAMFCYLQFFPPPYHVDGWGTYAYFRVLEEIHASTQPTNALNAEAQDENHQNESNNASMEMSSTADPGTAVEDLESGRRET